MKTCPFCTEEIQDEAIVCRYCGKDLAAEMWYVAIDGNKIGPMAKDVLISRLKSGEYPVGTASVWTEGQEEWAPAVSLGINAVVPARAPSEKKKGIGCIATLGIMFLFFVAFFMLMFMTSFVPDRPSPSPQRTPSASAPASSSSNQTFTLSDGSQLTVSNIRQADDWACGSRKTGAMNTPAASGRVVLYFGRDGELFSINAQAGNQKIYDNALGRECLMNWKTKQMELLTEEEYARFEKDAGVQ